MNRIIAKIAGLGEAGHRISDMLMSQEVADRLDRIPNRLNELGYDNWGMRPETVKRALSLVRPLIESYFRLETHGIENVPAGRVLLVGNHGGQLPLDGGFVFYAMAMYAEPPRIMRAMVERWIPSLPFVSTLMIRCGQVTGEPLNCRKLLEQEEAVLVFPEGVRGSGKTFWHRYRLQRFGTGFMRLALETNTPIVPVAVIGGEEAYPALWNLQSVANLIKVPYFPVTPTWPLLGPVGLIPVPVKVRLHFGEPLKFEGDFDGPEFEIQKRVDVVKEKLRGLVGQGLKARGSKYF